jgi:hypothetical protein
MRPVGIGARPARCVRAAEATAAPTTQPFEITDETAFWLAVEGSESGGFCRAAGRLAPGGAELAPVLRLYLTRIQAPEMEPMKINDLETGSGERRLIARSNLPGARQPLPRRRS